MIRVASALLIVLVGCDGAETRHDEPAPETAVPAPTAYAAESQATPPTEPTRPSEPTEPTPPPEPPRPATVSYRRDIQPIWDRYCNGCHAVRAPQLTSPGSRQSLDAVSSRGCAGGQQLPLVVPGAPEESFLYFKVSGEFDVPIVEAGCDRLMPIALDGRATPLIGLDRDAVELIRTWIREGALED